MVRTWLDQGHRISAIVGYRQKRTRFLSDPVGWLVFQWTVMRHLRRHRVPIIDPKPPIDWRQLKQTLLADEPDVAITYGFMRLIPKSMTDIFPLGALNFHPALLPEYRGPQPYHWLALHDAWDRYGGVTLHEMTGRFDEGPIIAQAAMLDAPVRDGINGFLADALATMTRDVIPRYCHGEVRAWPQPQGDYFYARAQVPEAVVQPSWTRSQLRFLCAAFVRRPGVTIDIAGNKIRLLAEARAVGLPSGTPPALRWRTVEFDVADARVTYWRRTRFNRLVYSLSSAPSRFRRPESDVPIRLGPFKVAPAASTDVSQNSTGSA